MFFHYPYYAHEKTEPLRPLPNNITSLGLSGKLVLNPRAAAQTTSTGGLICQNLRLLN